MTPTNALIPAQAAARLDDYTVIDVRTPGEYASGHLPGAHNIPLDHLHTALPALKTAAARGTLLMVCASGNRSTTACTELAAADIPATTLTGGTAAWAGEGDTPTAPTTPRPSGPPCRSGSVENSMIHKSRARTGPRAPYMIKPGEHDSPRGLEGTLGSNSSLRQLGSFPESLGHFPERVRSRWGSPTWWAVDKYPGQAPFFGV